MPEGLYINNRGPYSFEYSEAGATTHTDCLPAGLRPDPEWFHIDDTGHLHGFNFGADECLLPTLKEVHISTSGDKEYQCSICGEEVRPHFLTGTTLYENIPGPKTDLITIPRYDRDIGHDDRISFYASNMFGFARVAGFSFRGAGTVGMFDGKSISVTFACEFIVWRSVDL